MRLWEVIFKCKTLLPLVAEFYFENDIGEGGSKQDNRAMPRPEVAPPCPPVGGWVQEKLKNEVLQAVFFAEVFSHGVDQRSQDEETRVVLIVGDCTRQEQ